MVAELGGYLYVCVACSVGVVGILGIRRKPCYLGSLNRRQQKECKLGLAKGAKLPNRWIASRERGWLDAFEEKVGVPRGRWA